MRLAVTGSRLHAGYLRRHRGGRFRGYLIKDECSDTLPHATDPSAARFFSERESASVRARRRQEEERTGAPGTDKLQELSIPIVDVADYLQPGNKHRWPTFQALMSLVRRNSTSGPPLLVCAIGSR